MPARLAPCDPLGASCSDKSSSSARERHRSPHDSAHLEHENIFFAALHAEQLRGAEEDVCGRGVRVENDRGRGQGARGRLTRVRLAAAVGESAPRDHSTLEPPEPVPALVPNASESRFLWVAPSSTHPWLVHFSSNANRLAEVAIAAGILRTGGRG